MKGWFKKVTEKQKFKIVNQKLKEEKDLR